MCGAMRPFRNSASDNKTGAVRRCADPISIIELSATKALTAKANGLPSPARGFLTDSVTDIQYWSARNRRPNTRTSSLVLSGGLWQSRTLPLGSMERQMKACRHWFAVIAFMSLAAPAFAQQPSPAGRIKVVSGAAFIVRSGGDAPRRGRAARLRGGQAAHRRGWPHRHHAG